jgi:hypothetical protein
VLALIEAAGFIDADPAAQAGGFGPLLEFGVQIAGSIGGAGGTRCAFGARVMADKDVALKGGHGVSPVTSWIPTLSAKEAVRMGHGRFLHGRFGAFEPDPGRGSTLYSE